MRRSHTLCPCSISLSSEGVSEKKAISDAETKPEQKSRIPATTIAATTPTVGETNCIEEKASAMGCQNDDISKMN